MLFDGLQNKLERHTAELMGEEKIFNTVPCAVKLATFNKNHTACMPSHYQITRDALPKVESSRLPDCALSIH